jgi:tetratricopeptide (TPR) repeat protein
MGPRPVVALVVLATLFPSAPAHLVAAPASLPQAPLTDLVPYWQIVDEYRAGRAREAARQLSAFGERRLDRAFLELEHRIRLDEPEGTSWSLARLKAAVVMHTDLVLAGLVELPTERAAHLEFARRLVNLKGGRVRGQADDHTLPGSFRKRWHLWLAWTAHQALDLALLARQVEVLEREFPKDADVLLTAGSFSETLAWPRLSTSTLVPGALKRRGSRTDWLRDAETHYRRALSLAPDLAEARLRLGRVLHERERSAEALATLTPLLTFDDARLAYLARLFAGSVCETRGRWADAGEHYRAAVALRPELATPHIALSQVLRRLGDVKGAFTEAAEALKSGEGINDPWWEYQLGQGYRAAALGYELIEEALK